MEAPPKHPDVAEQFGALLRALAISGNQLAVALGTSQQAISNYTSGRNKPGREILATIAKKYPAISLSWLLTGEGEPFPNGRYNEKPAPTSTKEETTQEETAAEAEVDSQPPTNKLRINKDGQNETYWQGVAGERLKRIEQLELTNERLWGQNTELLKKPDASLDAADAYAAADEVLFQYPILLVEQTPDWQRFPVGRKPCVERQMNIGFGRQHQA